MRKVAVTGSIASGKTTVCHFFQELGAFVISADTIVHQLLTPSNPIGQRVIALFGDEIVVEGKIEREEIAKRVFRDPSLLTKLEKLLHPEVQKVIETTFKQVSQHSFPLFVAEVPLLYEAGLESFYDAVIVVSANRDQARERFKGNDFEKRENRLIPLSEKILKADYLIENEGSLDLLRKSVIKTFNRLKG